MDNKVYLVQRIIDDEFVCSLMNDLELIHYIDMQDICTEEYTIWDMSEIGKARRLYYSGWQPGCLIEIVDEDENVVVSGYGVDH